MERLQKGVWVVVVGGGADRYCYTVQCRLVSNYSSTHVTHEEKERERMGIELNEQMGGWILHNFCRWVLLRFWSVCVGFLLFLC